MSHSQASKIFGKEASEEFLASIIAEDRRYHQRREERRLTDASRAPVPAAALSSESVALLNTKSKEPAGRPLFLAKRKRSECNIHPDRIKEEEE